MQLIDDSIDFEQYAQNLEGQYLKPASAWTDALVDRITNQHMQPPGDLLPWGKTHHRVRLRPGELSLWAGINGHGKSLMLSQVMAWLMDVSTVAVASMEMPPVATMERMLSQVTGLERPHIRQAREFSTWTDEKLWIYDQQDSVPTDRILGMVRYAIHELDVRHIVIDSLMKCGIRPDDYGAQKDFVDRLCWSAKNTNAHIHLVLHMRKGRTESDIPSKFDVKGAGEITDLADNLFIVHRNKDKEEKIDAGELVTIDTPDQTLTVAKQRHGKWEGRFNFFFHEPSQQYLEVSGDFPMTFPVEFSAFPDREVLQ